MANIPHDGTTSPLGTRNAPRTEQWSGIAPIIRMIFGQMSRFLARAALLALASGDSVTIGQLAACLQQAGIPAACIPSTKAFLRVVRQELEALGLARLDCSKFAWMTLRYEVQVMDISKTAK